MPKLPTLPQRHDLMRYFIRDSPAVKLTALLIVRLPRIVASCGSVLGLGWLLGRW